MPVIILMFNKLRACMCWAFNSKKKFTYCLLCLRFTSASPPFQDRSKTVPIIGQKWDLRGNYNGLAKGLYI